jgi:general secretion pathway protein D
VSPTARGRRARNGLLALWPLLLCACAGEPERPPAPIDAVIADEGQGGERLPPPPTDFVDFPPAPDLLPRDFVMEEEAGALKGYLTRFYRVRSQSGKELIGIINHWKSEKARVVDVPQHNMLVITETRENMPILQRILEQVDIVPPQVEIEAKVVEILELSNFEYGFELLVDKAPAGNTALRGYGATFNSSSFLQSLTDSASPFQGTTFNFATVGSVVEELGDLDLILRALESEGYAEVVSAPRIVCRSGQRALLRTATKLPIQDFILQSTNNPRITTRFEDVGVTLEVAPTVVGRDAITVEVKPSVSNVVRFEVDPTTGGIPIPVIASRSASTQVDIRNGEILVIGGLLDRQIRQGRRGVPILMHIPFVGKLFTSIDDASQKTNVVIVLRIRILTSAEKARNRDAIPRTREEQVREEEHDEAGEKR